MIPVFSNLHHLHFGTVPWRKQDGFFNFGILKTLFPSDVCMSTNETFLLSNFYVRLWSLPPLFRTDVNFAWIAACFGGNGCFVASSIRARGWPGLGRARTARIRGARTAGRLMSRRLWLDLISVTCLLYVPLQRCSICRVFSFTKYVFSIRTKERYVPYIFVQLLDAELCRCAEMTWRDFAGSSPMRI